MLLIKTVVGDFSGLFPSSFCNDSIILGLVERNPGETIPEGFAGWKPTWVDSRRYGVVNL